ncbi:DUF4811 domain-containing protein [Weissella kandleri]|nr:DUF4811 domain-containing protein [Weissella kandleri]
MLILLIAGVVLLVLAGISYYQKHSVRYWMIIVGLLLVLIDGIGMGMAGSKHLFMEKQTMKKTVQLSSKSSVVGKSFIVTTNAKNGTFNYHYTWKNKNYRVNPKDGATHFEKGDKAVLKEQISNYQATNFFDKFMLVGLTTQTEPNVEYTFVLPDNWYIITKQQNDEIQKMIAESKAGMDDKIKKGVTDAIEAEVKKNPDYLKDKDAQKDTQNKIVQQVTGEINDDLTQKVDKKLTEWNVAK